MHQHSKPRLVKGQFSAQIDSVIKCIPAYEHIYLLGDFNVRVDNDQVYCNHDIGKMNENGPRLIKLCCYPKLYVINTYFQNKICQKASWRHPKVKLLSPSITSETFAAPDLIRAQNCKTNHSLKIKTKTQEYLPFKEETPAEN